ncbi:hypothetical protein ACSBR1_031136 [Camellia fascicularis]
MQCFLKDADAKQVEHEIIHHLVGEIREVGYDAENVIATFFFKVVPRRRRGIRNILGLIGLPHERERSSSEEDFIGFEQDIKILVAQLQWQLKDLLQRILTKLIPEKKDDVVRMIEDDLVKLLFEVQQQKKCLGVLDDIWSSDAWVSLSPAFPKVNMGSKISLTSRKKNVITFVDPNGFVLEHKCLSKQESWKLFEKKAFLKTDTTGTNLTQSHWQKVQQNGRVLDALPLSYQDLPHQLKACFLHLGNYPEDFDIDAERLYQLWMAEGFISQEERGEHETMMDVAERYLGELPQRFCLCRKGNGLLCSWFSSSQESKLSLLHIASWKKLKMLPNGLRFIPTLR